MAAMKPRTGDGPLEVTKEGRGIVMRVPLGRWRPARGRAQRRRGESPRRGAEPGHQLERESHQACTGPDGVSHHQGPLPCHRLARFRALNRQVLRADSPGFVRSGGLAGGLIPVCRDQLGPAVSPIGTLAAGQVGAEVLDVDLPAGSVARQLRDGDAPLLDPQPGPAAVGDQLGLDHRLVVLAAWTCANRRTGCRSTLSPGEDDETVIEAGLAADGDRTWLWVEERGIPVPELPWNGAGWQVHVEDLGTYLAGRERADWRARWAGLIPAYRDQVPGEPA